MIGQTRSCRWGIIMGSVCFLHNCKNSSLLYLHSAESNIFENSAMPVTGLLVGHLGTKINVLVEF